ncbi:hypothetical protein QZH41_016746 [Actinostola sp. cb2023]|nr:hypothetical protein QZH41_016746 [Actinostola sp. cb2023]
MFTKRSQAAVQSLNMSEENQEMIQGMLQDLQVDCASDEKAADDQEPDEKYWGKFGDKRLQVECVTVYPDWDSTQRFSDEANQFALKRLTQCGFERGRCLAALSKCDGDVGAALEHLVCTCCKKERNENPEYNPETFEAAKQQRDEECLALKSIYDENFTESIPDKLWTVNMSMQFLEHNFKVSLKNPTKNDARKGKKQKLKSKNVCKYFVMGNCKFGSKCKMSHALQDDERIRPEDEHLKIPEKAVNFILEVRFSKGSLYPFEPPVLVFYTTSEYIPPFVSLNITKILNKEAQEMSESCTPVVFSVMGILEDSEKILTYAAKLPPSAFSKPERANTVTEPVHLPVETNTKIDLKVPQMSRNSESNSSKEMKIKEKEALNRKLKLQFDKQKTLPSYKSMLEDRIKLPAWNSKDDIISSLKSHQVLVISGMTGCGKTTQIPQFILDAHLEVGQVADCNIICTQPRRISAISVAERVANERAEKLGDVIGYKIRMESKQSSSTRLLYCTTGILLRILENDCTLSGVSHVIVDEIHERTEESDFLMMVLRDLVMERHDLCIILMSATLNAKLFSEYFYDAPVIHIPGRTFPVQEYYLEDALEKTQFQMDARSQYARPMKRSKVKALDDGMFKGAGNSQNLTKMAAEAMTSCKKPADNIKDELLTERQLEMRYKGFSKTTISALYTMDYEKTNYDLIVTVLEWIVTGKHEHSQTGAILIFLSGLAEIMTLMEQLNNHTIFKDSKRLVGMHLCILLRVANPFVLFIYQHKGVRISFLIVKQRQLKQQNHTSEIVTHVVPYRIGASTMHDVIEGISVTQKLGWRAASTKGKKHNRFSVRHQRRWVMLIPVDPSQPNVLECGGFAKYDAMYLYLSFFRFLTIPLHSTLSSDEQALVFKRPQEGVTKIVLSTNIAETSVTIDDIVYVIDCGKMKETRYDSSKGMESLEETWVSRANARQRRGRAGRVTSGVCFHMFTSRRYGYVMQEHQIPEIKRVPLEKLCLRIKIMTLFHGHDVKAVLNRLLEPPSDNAVRDSLARLHSLGALDTSENLTSLGYHLAALPVDVRIGKLMLLGAIFRCLDPVLTIAAALSYKSPFIAPFDKRDEADKKRKQFSIGCSDHLTLLNAYQSWLDVMKKGTSIGYRYCYDNYLSIKTLQMIASLKCLFAELLADIGFLQTKMTSRQLERLSPRTGDGVLSGTGPAVNSNADNQKLLLGVLCGALYPNVVQVIKPETKYKASSTGK